MTDEFEKGVKYERDRILQEIKQLMILHIDFGKVRKSGYICRKPAIDIIRNK